MIHLSKRFIHLLWKICLILIFFGGFLIASLRLFLPMVTNYHLEIENFIAESLNRPVSIGEISAHMNHFWPELTLNKITIKNQQNEPALYIEKAWTTFSVLAYLKNQQFVLNNLTLSGISLQAKRDLNGNIKIAGFEIKANKKQQTRQFNHLKMPKNIEILHTSIDWVDEIKGIKQQLNRFNLHLERHKYTYDGSLQFELPLQLKAQPIKALIHFSFQNQYSQTFDGRSMLSIQSIELEKLFAQLALPEIKKMSLGLDLWMTWKNSIPIKVIGEFDHQQIEINKPALKIDQFSGGFEILKNKDGWQLSVQPELLLINKRIFHFNEINLYYRMRANQHQLSLFQDRFDLSFLQFIATQIKLNQKDLPNINLKGFLDNIYFLVFFEKDQPLLWQLSTDIKHLKLRNWATYPGIGDIHGHLLLQPDYAAFNLKIKDGIFYWPNMLRRPISLNQVEGLLTAQKWSDGWLFDTKHLILNTPDIETEHRLSIFLPTHQKPYIDWQTNFKNANYTNIPDYYPIKILSPTLVKWLDNAIIKAKIPQGFGLFRGQVSDFPFENNQAGHFEVAFDIKDGELAYLADFPAIKNLQGTVRFLDRGLKFENASGTTFDANLLNVSGEIADFKITRSMKIQGEIDGKLSTYKKFLIETPLKQYLGKALSPLSFKNPAKIDLTLDVPIQKDTDFHFESLLHLENNSLSVIDQNIHLTEIKGKLLISDQKVKASAIQTKLNGYPLKVNVKQQTNGDIHINGDGNLGLKGFLGQNLAYLNKDIKGKSAWHLLLNIPSSKIKNPASLTLTSNLVGIESSLPQPFQKNKKEIKKLFLSLPFSEGLAHLKYNDLLFGLFQFTDKNDSLSLTKGNLQFYQTPKLPKKDIIFINGKLNRLNLDHWIDFSNQLLESNNIENQSQSKLPPIQTNLSFKNVLFKNKEQGYCQFLVTEQTDKWLIDIDNHQLEGRVKWFKTGQQLTIDLNKLRLNIDDITTQKNTDNKPKKTISNIDPNRLPAIQLSIKKLFINEFLLGKVALKAVKVHQGLSFETVKIEGDLLKYLAQGQWLQSFSKKNRITFNAQFNTEHFGELLQVFMEKPPLNKGAADINIDMTWQQPINEISAVNGEGKMLINLTDGHLNDVDAGAAGRLINLLNLSGLIRKVKLSFDTEKGFDFEKIAGTLFISKNKVTTTDLLLESNPADVEISGDIQMSSEDINLILAITPHLSSTIPLAAALVGGPAAGVVALIAERAMGKQMDKMTKIKYFATGTLRDVKLKREAFKDAFLDRLDQLKINN